MCLSARAEEGKGSMTTVHAAKIELIITSFSRARSPCMTRLYFKRIVVDKLLSANFHLSKRICHVILLKHNVLMRGKSTLH